MDIIDAVLSGILKDLFAMFMADPAPLINEGITIFETPSTMVDVTPDPGLNDELQDDLESQLAAGGSPSAD